MGDFADAPIRVVLHVRNESKVGLRSRWRVAIRRGGAKCKSTVAIKGFAIARIR